MAGSLDELLGSDVVLDTATPIVYMGRLESCDAGGFWLSDADMHNCNEGHASREQYITEASIDGVRVNRKRIYVFRHTVISMSALSDVVSD